MNLQKEYNQRKEIIINRLDEFKRIKQEELFYELCFCLLTPQCPAKKADAIVG